MKVHVVPPDPRWGNCFDAEAAAIRAVLGGLPVWVHHIGSTSVPNLCAKPVIDILLEVADIESLDGRCAAFESLGYEVKGEFGIPGRRYYRKDSESGVRTHQVHAFERSSEGAIRHLAFRDYLMAHPAVAEAYGELKRRLAIRFSEDMEGYIDGKDGFIQEHERRALRWRGVLEP